MEHDCLKANHPSAYAIEVKGCIYVDNKYTISIILLKNNSFSSVRSVHSKLTNLFIV